MVYTEKARIVTLVLLVSLAMAYLVFMVATLAADGRTTSANLVPQNVHHFITLPGGDIVYNWDYRVKTTSRDKVDWAMRFIFADNATINKVKNRIDGVSNDPSISPLLPTSGTVKFAHITDNNYPNEDWDKDSGKKNAVDCGWNWGHARFYANGPSDYNQNPTLGHYIVATIHRDNESLWGCDNQYISTEDEEEDWVNRIEDNLLVSPYNWSFNGTVNWQNAMSNTDISYPDSDDSHLYQSNGTGRIVNVP